MRVVSPIPEAMTSVVDSRHQQPQGCLIRHTHPGTLMVDDGMQQDHTQDAGIYFISKGSALKVNKAVHRLVPVLAWKERCCGRGQGWPVPTTAFPQPSRFHRNKTTHPQQPRLTRCTVLHLQKIVCLLSSTIYLQPIYSSVSR